MSKFRIQPQFAYVFALVFWLTGCQSSDEETAAAAAVVDTIPAQSTAANAVDVIAETINVPSPDDIYAPVVLTADLSHLNANQKTMIGLLIEASQIMDDLFWLQSYGDKDALLGGIEDPDLRRYVEINYGPWDRLAGDAPFIPNVGPKPPGARFYPPDMSEAEFEAWKQPGKTGLYSLVRRSAEGQLELVPYHEAYADRLKAAGALLRNAAELAEDPGFAGYLKLRADALETDNYRPSDMAWMEMKTNPLELIIGAIETYEDRLFGYRAAYAGIVMVKDLAWSERLARFADFLPALQQGLPVPDVYKREMPGSNADLGAYDVVYYAGHSNAGGKSIAVNLPNDEAVQLARGTRRMQLKNAMRAKFDKILVPIAELLIAEDQRRHITFDAFFENTMFHEVAHGLGIKNTVDGRNTVRKAMKDHASALEEGKADILGLYMVQKLREQGEMTEGELMDNYVTFMAGIFRSVRFGAASAHGQANMMRFNYFEEAGAFARDAATGTYGIDVPAFEKAVRNFSHRLLTLQGDGDYTAVDRFVTDNADIGEQLQADLERVAMAGIPVDIVFIQGPEQLGL